MQLVAPAGQDFWQPENHYNFDGLMLYYGNSSEPQLLVIFQHNTCVWRLATKKNLQFSKFENQFSILPSVVQA